jgi:hypothetical protein
MRQIKASTVAFVVRIALGAYHVVGQADSMRAALPMARRGLASGPCFVRRRDDGVRFTVGEMEAEPQLTPEQERNAQWEHDNL